MDLSVQALKHARTRGVTALFRAEAPRFLSRLDRFRPCLPSTYEHHAEPEVLLGEVMRPACAGGR